MTLLNALTCDFFSDETPTLQCCGRGEWSTTGQCNPTRIYGPIELGPSEANPNFREYPLTQFVRVGWKVCIKGRKYPDRTFTSLAIQFKKYNPSLSQLQTRVKLLVHDDKNHLATAIFVTENNTVLPDEHFGLNQELLAKNIGDIFINITLVALTQFKVDIGIVNYSVTSGWFPVDRVTEQYDVFRIEAYHMILDELDFDCQP